MLHWPDSMATYLTGDNVFFSNGAFGQHYATNVLFNDLVDQAELDAECLKYYANILTPFSALVDKKIQEVLALNLRSTSSRRATGSSGARTRRASSRSITSGAATIVRTK